MRMLHELGFWTELTQVVRYVIAQHQESVALLEKQLRHGFVEETRLMRNRIVNQGNHLAMSFQTIGDVCVAGYKERHPITDNQYFRTEGLYGFHRLKVGERVDAIQHPLIRYGHRLIALLHILRLAGK